MHRLLAALCAVLALAAPTFAGAQPFGVQSPGAPSLGLRSGAQLPSCDASATLAVDYTANSGAGDLCYAGARYGSLSSILGWSFTRASTKAALDSQGIVHTFASGVPAITDLGFLVEQSSTNSLLNSINFTAGWALGTGGAISANSVLAPDGTMTASAYTYPSSVSQFAALEQSVSGDASQANTYSVWLKLPSGTRTLDLGIGNITAGSKFSSPVTVTTTWRRFTFTLASGNLTNTGQVGVGFLGAGGTPISPGDIIDVWNEQLELGASVASSDIFTTSAAVTRAADAAAISFTGSPAAATVTYGNGSAANPAAASPINLGASSGGAWVGGYVKRLVVK